MPASSVLGLFDDDDDLDGADLFGSKPVAKPSNGPKDHGVKERPQQPKPAPASSTAAKTKGLFGDSNDDDDDGGDLFGGGPPPLPQPIKQMQPKKVSQKIFSDDSSDDDLFGGGKVVAQKNLPKSSAGSSSNTNTSVIPKTSKNTKISEKLFSDSEDDDLFGGSKAKSTG